MKESDIQKTILDYLTLRGIFHYKNNTAGIYKQATGSYIPSPSVGAPDIVAVIGGKYIGIEVKRPGGKMSEHQLRFKENLERAGGIYWIFDSIDAAVGTLEDYQ
jgi:hypothetical protein